MHFLKKKNTVWHFQQRRHAITLTGVHPLISQALTYSIPANLFTFIGVTFFILLKSAKIFRRGPIISEDVRRRSEDFQRCYAEFHLTEHRNTKEH